MRLSDYVSVEKCDSKTSTRIQLWIVGICVISYLLIVYSPTEMLLSYFGYRGNNGCTLYTFLGVPCPACGMGRSLSVILHFNFADMFYYNPSAVFVYAFVFLLLALILILSIFRYRLILKSKLLKLWLIPVLVLIIIWVLNILYGHHEHLYN
jgi:hypothetical protein